MMVKLKVLNVSYKYKHPFFSLNQIFCFVLVQSAKAIGTGRVGPRQLSSKTHFSIQKEIISPPTSVAMPETNYNNQYFNGKSMQPQQQHNSSQFQVNPQVQPQQPQMQQFSMNQAQPIQQQQQQQQMKQQQQLQIQQQLQQLYQQQFTGQQVKNYQPTQMLQNFPTQSPPPQIPIQQQQQTLSQSSIQTISDTFNNYHQQSNLTSKQYDQMFDHKEIPIITPRSNLQDRISRHRINAAQLEEKLTKNDTVDTVETTGVNESLAAAAAAPTSVTGTSDNFPITVGN